MKPTRAWLMGVALALAVSTTSVSVAQNSADGPSPCASVTDDRSRLQCYDAQEALKRGGSTTNAAVPPAPPAPAAAPAPVAPAVAPSPAPPPPRESAAASREFGSETLPQKVESKKGEAAKVVEEEQTARVKAVYGSRKGDYRIELDNGQIWAETQRTGGDPPKVGDTITLKRGTLGSYFMSKGAGLALRVKRVQ